MLTSTKRRTGYIVVAVGGTFDILHAGHHRLFSRAFSLGDRVLIGVSSDVMASSLGKNHPIRPFAFRVRDVKNFLEQRNWLTRARIVRINNPYGPAVKRKNLHAIVVTPPTKSNAEKINRIRRRNGLKILDIYVVGLVKAQDGRPISATRIRRGEIDSRGRIRKISAQA